MSTKNKIVCAANRHHIEHTDQLVIILGIRHYDKLMHEQYEARNWPQELIRNCEQGFVDAKGNWYTREGALGIARDAGQLPNGSSNLDKLFSEDLY